MMQRALDAFWLRHEFLDNRAKVAITIASLAVSVLPTAAQTPPPEDMVAVLSARLTQEIQRGFACDVSVLGLQRRVADLEKQLAEAKKNDSK